MKALKNVLIIILFSPVWISCTSDKKVETGKYFVQLTHNEDDQRVDILIDGQAFTSYLYTDTVPDLKKRSFTRFTLQREP